MVCIKTSDGLLLLVEGDEDSMGALVSPNSARLLDHLPGSGGGA